MHCHRLKCDNLMKKSFQILASNAAVSAGTDLSERLGAIRAQLRQQGAQGLQQLGQQALTPHYENTYQAPTEGMAAPLLGGLATAAGTAIGGPLGGMAAGALTSGLMNAGKGNGTQASPYQPGHSNYPR